MPTPSTYYTTQTELEAIKAMAFQLLRSDEVTLDGPLASRLADHVFDMTDAQAELAIKSFFEAKLK